MPTLLSIFDLPDDAATAITKLRGRGFDVLESTPRGAGEVMPHVARAKWAFEENPEPERVLFDLPFAGTALRTARTSGFEQVRRELRFRRGCLGVFFRHGYSFRWTRFWMRELSDPRVRCGILPRHGRGDDGLVRM